MSQDECEFIIRLLITAANREEEATNFIRAEVDAFLMKGGSRVLAARSKR